MVGNAAGSAQLPFIECVRPLRPEGQNEPLVEGSHVDRQHGPVALRANPIPEIPWLDDKAGIRVIEVAEDRGPARFRDHLLHFQPSG